MDSGRYAANTHPTPMSWVWFGAASATGESTGRDPPWRRGYRRGDTHWNGDSVDCRVKRQISAMGTVVSTPPDHNELSTE